MKKLSILFTLIFISFTGIAQIYNPVKWSFSAEAINEKEAYVVITAVIEKGWHVYSQFIDDGGPIPTSFTFNKSADFSLIGKAIEIPKAVSAFDKNFGMQIAWHEEEVVFKQKIALKKPEVKVSGSLEFMVCNDERCLPPDDLEFSIIAKAGKATPISASTTQNITVNPITSTLQDTIIQTEQNTNLSAKTDSSFVELKSEVKSNASLWAIFIAGFLGGLLALIMPCIFPMLPLTVSFFTKKAGSRSKAITQAFIYGFSIIVIYVALGLLITVFFGSDALNELASNGIFNFLFFALLVVFAISFLGAFEINLPTSWVNKIDAQSDKGGFLGLFFMAFALALVSFSCTGPIIGTLLVQAASMGELMGPAIGMLGFSIALAIPFTLFAAFPTLLKSLPKSGGWLNSVKVTLGFIELALAFKFLSNVDLAYHWDIFDREVFLFYGL